MKKQQKPDIPIVDVDVERVEREAMEQLEKGEFSIVPDHEDYAFIAGLRAGAYLLVKKLERKNKIYFPKSEKIN